MTDREVRLEDDRVVYVPARGRPYWQGGAELTREEQAEFRPLLSPGLTELRDSPDEEPVKRGAIMCDGCGCYDTRVYRTVNDEERRVVRRVRVCRHCGRKILTRERA
jgi:hypothetical protein